MDNSNYKAFVKYQKPRQHLDRQRQVSGKCRYRYVTLLNIALGTIGKLEQMLQGSKKNHTKIPRYPVQNPYCRR